MRINHNQILISDFLRQAARYLPDDAFQEAALAGITIEDADERDFGVYAFKFDGLLANFHKVSGQGTLRFHPNRGFPSFVDCEMTDLSIPAIVWEYRAMCKGYEPLMVRVEQRQA